MLQTGAIGACTGGAVIEDLCTAGCGERIELQHRILFESADAGIANKSHECPLFRPAIEGLADTPQGECTSAKAMC